MRHPDEVWVKRKDGGDACFRDGKLHRIIWPDGTRAWYCNNRRHRDRGPATIFPNGTRVWYRHGKKHRKNGPAIIWPNGTKEWWRYGKLILTVFAS